MGWWSDFKAAFSPKKSSSSSSSSNSSNSSSSSNSSNTVPTFKTLADAANAGYHDSVVNIEGKGLQTVAFADTNYNKVAASASAAANATAGGSSPSSSSSSSSNNIITSIGNDVKMGLGAIPKDQDFVDRTAATIATQRGPAAALAYATEMADDGFSINYSVPNAGGGAPAAVVPPNLDDLSFGEAFNAANSAQGEGGVFTYKGKDYTTNTAPAASTSDPAPFSYNMDAFGTSFSTPEEAAKSDLVTAASSTAANNAITAANNAQYDPRGDQIGTGITTPVVTSASNPYGSPLPGDNVVAGNMITGYEGYGSDFSNEPIITDAYNPTYLELLAADAEKPAPGTGSMGAAAAANTGITTPIATTSSVPGVGSLDAAAGKTAAGMTAAQAYFGNLRPLFPASAAGMTAAQSADILRDLFPASAAGVGSLDAAAATNTLTTTPIATTSPVPGVGSLDAAAGVTAAAVVPTSTGPVVSTSTNPRIGYESGQDILQASPDYLTGLDGSGPNTVGQVDDSFYGGPGAAYYPMAAIQTAQNNAYGSNNLVNDAYRNVLGGTLEEVGQSVAGAGRYMDRGATALYNAPANIGLQVQKDLDPFAKYYSYGKEIDPLMQMAGYGPTDVDPQLAMAASAQKDIKYNPSIIPQTNITGASAFVAPAAEYLGEAATSQFSKISPEMTKRQADAMPAPGTTVDDVFNGKAKDSIGRPYGTDLLATAMTAGQEIGDIAIDVVSGKFLPKALAGAFIMTSSGAAGGESAAQGVEQTLQADFTSGALQNTPEFQQAMSIYGDEALALKSLQNNAVDQALLTSGPTAALGDYFGAKLLGGGKRAMAGAPIVGSVTEGTEKYFENIAAGEQGSNIAPGYDVGGNALLGFAGEVTPTTVALAASALNPNPGTGSIDAAAATAATAAPATLNPNLSPTSGTEASANTSVPSAYDAAAAAEAAAGSTATSMDAMAAQEIITDLVNETGTIDVGILQRLQAETGLSMNELGTMVEAATSTKLTPAEIAAIEGSPTGKIMTNAPVSPGLDDEVTGNFGGSNIEVKPNNDGTITLTAPDGRLAVVNIGQDLDEAIKVFDEVVSPFSAPEGSFTQPNVQTNVEATDAVAAINREAIIAQEKAYTAAMKTTGDVDFAEEAANSAYNGAILDGGLEAPSKGTAPVIPDAQILAEDGKSSVDKTPASGIETVLGTPAAGSGSLDIANTFTTSKGSTYKSYGDGTTVRNRAERTKFGLPDGEGSGVQPQSQQTVFMTKEAADEIGPLFQNTAIPTKLVIDGNTAKLVHLEDFGPKKAGTDASKTVTLSTDPEVGLQPVEIMDTSNENSRNIHFGSSITEVSSGIGSIDAAATAAVQKAEEDSNVPESTSEEVAEIVEIVEDQGIDPNDAAAMKNLVTVYHATSGAPFSAVDQSIMEKATGYNSAASGPGFYGSTSPRYPSEYVGGQGSLMRTQVDTSTMLDAANGTPLTTDQADGVVKALSDRKDGQGNDVQVSREGDTLNLTYETRKYPDGLTKTQTKTVNLNIPQDVFDTLKEFADETKNPMFRDESGLSLESNQSGDTQNLRDILIAAGFTGTTGISNATGGGSENVVVFDPSTLSELETVIDQGPIPTTVEELPVTVIANGTGSIDNAASSVQGTEDGGAVIEVAKAPGIGSMDAASGVAEDGSTIVEIADTSKQDAAEDGSVVVPVVSKKDSSTKKSDSKTADTTTVIENADGSAEVVTVDPAAADQAAADQAAADQAAADQAAADQAAADQAAADQAAADQAAADQAAADQAAADQAAADQAAADQAAADQAAADQAAADQAAADQAAADQAAADQAAADAKTADSDTKVAVVPKTVIDTVTTVDVPRGRGRGRGRGRSRSNRRSRSRSTRSGFRPRSPRHLCPSNYTYRFRWERNP